MEEQKVNNAVKPAPKTNRRGIANARGTSRLKFSHTHMDTTNGLFMAHLDSVAVTMIKIGEDKTGMPSFNGLEIPRITFTFASNEASANSRKYVTLSFTAVESNANTTIEGKESWKVSSVFDWIKHILDVYMLKGREFTDEEAEMLSLTFEDFDEQGDYVPVEPEVVIAAWTALFENVENMLNRGNNGTPYYKVNGKFIPVWIKLVRYIRNKKKDWQEVNNGELAFPTFVGEGAIEIYRKDAAPELKLNTLKECVLPKNIEKPKQPNFQAPMMGGNIGIMGGATMVNPAAGFSTPSGINDISVEAADDIPF